MNYVENIETPAAGMLGAGLGALGAATGVESTFAKNLAKGITSKAATIEAIEAAGKKEAKEMLCHYLEHNGRAKDAKVMRGVPDSQIRVTPAWACRMTLVGLELTEHEQCIVDDQISLMLKAKQEAKKPEEKKGK